MGNNTRSKTVREKIVSHTSSLDKTCEIYNEVLAYVIEVMYKEFNLTDDFSAFDAKKIIEKLIHKTKNNPDPKYTDFDTLFYKLPRDFRRAAINAAFGKWCSWRSNLANWENEKKEAIADGKKFTKKPPRIQFKHNDYPVLYNGTMFNQSLDGYKIKVFRNNDWVWEEIKVKEKTDLTKRGIDSWNQCCPKLVKRGKKYFLAFSYEAKVPLHKKKDKHDVRVLAIDLGLNNDAVCSVMECDGTIVDSLFVKQSAEKDHLLRLVNKLKVSQRQTRGAECPRYWNTINGLRKEIVNDTAHQIIEFAKKHNVETIVFEHLGNMKMPKGFYGAKRLRFKLHYWDQIGLENKVEEMAHYLGMRISRVNPRGTSMYAFDGSGKIERSQRGDLCTFTTGKQYHSDLNASYNIGARYFITAKLKSLSEKKRLVAQAKVPELLVRANQTLDTLLKFNACQVP